MFTAMIFLKDVWYKSEGETPEQAISALQDLRSKDIGYKIQFTYRPADGTIYFYSVHIPIGVVFKKG